MTKTNLAEVIFAISHTMSCDRCPYPCKAKEKSSQANCDMNWYSILTNLETDGITKQDTRDKLFRLHCTKIT